MFGALYAADGSSTEALIEVAREFSPRIERCGPREITLDLSGLTHLFGDARTIGAELRRTAADRGLRVRVAIAGTRTAARLFVHHRAGLTVIEPGTEPDALAPLPLTLLATLGNANGNGNGKNGPNDLISRFHRWGLRTLGDLSGLPSASVAARLGQAGVGWQRLARGVDAVPLVPAIPEERFEQALDLEWPIDGLEPLSFVIGRLMDPLSAHLERRGRGAAVLHVRLHLVTRVMHERSLQLPVPMRDARTLRTLALLDLESHPPPAAIDRVVVAVDPTPGRIVQFSLLTRPLPSPEQLSTLNARLTALMGEGRCGSPVGVDSWKPGAFAMKPFAPRDSNAIHPHGPRRHGDTEPNVLRGSVEENLRASVPPWPVEVNGAANVPVVALRRFRMPIPVRVHVEEGKPSRVSIDRRGMSGGCVENCAGPWRTSGAWWMEPWDRDEWDVTLSDSATYRIFRDRRSDAWCIEGIVDWYIELHAASAFSFLQGASLPETLIERAAALGYPAIALLDADGVYGAPRFHKAALRAGLRAIIGAELTIANSQLPTSNSQSRGPKAQSPTWQLPVLVESAEGYKNLCRLVTRMKMRAPKGEGALALEELDGFTTGLVALSGRPLLDVRHYGVAGLLDRLVGVFGRRNVCIELQRHLLRDDEADIVALDALARAFRVPVIATNGVRFAEPADRPLFDVLTCVRHKTTLDAAGRRLARNAERYLKSPEAMAALFADRRDALAGTAALAERLQYTMTDLGYQFPKYPVPDGESETSFLRHITEVGARERYRPYHDKARAQIGRELDLIEKLELAGYFLIVWDIVNYCRQQDILVQGRGSAANSAVCYSLGITAVDPIKMELLFERFLSEERGEWPDIDLDLPSGDRRERVIQHVYEKYGRLGAAMTANVITYRSRSAAREVGKALSLDDEEIDRLAKVMNNFEFTDPNDTFGRNLDAAGLSLNMPRMRTFAESWLRIQDLPRHLGQHSGGMVICQGALDSVVPLEPASMPGRVVIQWDKDDCAEMGIVKVDLLGLGMMAVLQDAIEFVNTAEGRGKGEGETSDFDLAHIPQDDPAVYDMLQKAETIGVFQVESRAQMATLPRLKPTHFYDLVVQVAIIRPGPIVGDMVHPYLNRRAGREPIVPLHPSLEPVLRRTLGVPLFQEQLLRMAMVAAGFTGGQAEELRRAMGFKRSEKRMKQIEVQLRDGMARNGITGETAERIITSITSFALYGFPESHAASFALLAYASAYLKVHYPGAFFTALLNNQPMGFYHPASLVKDAQRRGVRFHPIDVQQSDWLCRVEEDGAIRIGLMYVNGLRKEMGQAMAAFDRTKPLDAARVSTDATRAFTARVECTKCGSDDESMIETVREEKCGAGLHGPRRTYFCNTCAHEWTIQLQPVGRFTSIDDVVRRTGLRRDELTTLADIGALNDFTNERRSALWQVEKAVRPAGELFNEGDGGKGEGGRGASPLRTMNDDERLRSDYAGMGLTIGPHPMALRRDDLALRGVIRASDLLQARDGRRVRVAGMVITRQRPGTAKGFVFLTLEDETGISNVIVRPDLFDRERMTVIRHPFLLVEGVLQHQEGVLSVKAERLQGIDGGASVNAHDFY